MSKTLTETVALAVRHALNGPTMGTRYAAVFYAAPSANTPELAEALAAAVTAVDMQMSTWKPHSDLMRLNRAPVGEWVAVPQLLLTVLACGLEVGRQSEGAFDIGLGDLVRAWGFNDAAGVPDAKTVAALKAQPRSPAHSVLELDMAGGRVRKNAPIALDLSGIAKGFGVDRLAETLDAAGITDYVVSIDGEVRAHGTKPGGLAWRVAVESPDKGRRDVAGVVELRDSALATSGDYRHLVVLDGEEHSHTMDLRTGAPLVSDIAAVTTRASTCMLADAWATACLVLGPERGLPLARANAIEALFALR